MLNIEFKKGKWEEFLDCAYTARYELKPKFVQESDHIRNCESKENECGFDQTTILTKQKYAAGTKISTCCSFDKDYAPLLIFANNLYKDSENDLRFDDYYEVVLYKDGINVWRLYKDSAENKMKWHLLLGVNFKVTPKEKHTLTVELAEKAFKIKCGSEDIVLRIADLPKQMHAGITACEGINRFYSLDIED